MEERFIANSKIIITWNIPADTKFGEYRICHYGDAKIFQEK